MADSASDDCTCANKCPDYAHCICIGDYENHICRIYCTDDVIAAKREITAEEVTLAVAEKVALDGRIDFEMHGASLAEAGTLIADVADADIYVPADRIDERRDLYLRNVSLETAVRELGLMAIVRP